MRELMKDREAVYYVTYGGVQVRQLRPVRLEGKVKLNTIQKRTNEFRDLPMIPCGRELFSGQSLIQLGDLLFRDANIYVHADDGQYVLAVPTNICLGISKGEYNRLLRRISKRLSA